MPKPNDTQMLEWLLRRLCRERNPEVGNFLHGGNPQDIWRITTFALPHKSAPVTDMRAIIREAMNAE